MLLKHYDRSGIVTWSNSKTNSHLLACAPTPQLEEGPFELEILALDLAEKSKQLSVIGKTSYHTRFRSLAWDVLGEKDGSFQNGLLFGGTEDGGITIWDPYQITSPQQEGGNQSYPGLVYEEQQIIDYPILCAEWNSMRPQLLGFGANEVLVMDIGKGLSLQDPNISKISEKNPHVNSYVTAVAWNKEVAHIMASASQNGLIALWDVKTNKSIFSFKDNSHSGSNKKVSIAWSKSVFAQIAVTLDDENKNELQIWDLRNQKGPIVVIDKSHTKGINCMDWCDSDPELILASSKDNKVICWNYVREQPVSEMTLKEQVIDIKWSKKLPAIYFVSTESKLDVYSMDDNNLYSYIPKWYKVPVGTNVGPNSSILSYNNKHPNTLTELTYILKNDHLTQNIGHIKNFFKSSNDITSYVGNRKRETKGHQNEFWSLMELMASGGLEADIYGYLGFKRQNIVKEAEQYTGKKYDSHTKQTTTSKKPAKTNDYIHLAGEDAEKFFASMTHDFGNENIDESVDHQNVKYEMVPRNFNWDTGKERIIKQNLLIGNYTAAIDAALKCGRTAEALVIAYSQGTDIFRSTLKTFFTETTDSFITGTLRYIADRELEDMVKKYQLNQWKECVAFIYSLVHDQRPQLLKALAQRLLQDANSTNEALICLALAENFNELLVVFNKQISGMENGLERKIGLLNLVEKLLVIKAITNKQVDANPLFDKLILEATLIISEEAETDTALALIETANTQDEKIAGIRYMLACSNPQTRASHKCPFKPINIPVMQKKAKKADEKGPQIHKKLSIGKTDFDNNKKGPTRPVGITRPPPVAASTVAKEESRSFVPNQLEERTTVKQHGFHPNEGVRAPNVSQPPPGPLKKPTQYQVTQPTPMYSSQESASFNPSSAFEAGSFGRSGYDPQNITNNNINVPAKMIPSASNRNKPPPPPPSSVKPKKADTPENQTIYDQEPPISNYESKPPSRTNSIRPPPPPVPSSFTKNPEPKPVYQPKPIMPVPQSSQFSYQQQLPVQPAIVKAPSVNTPVKRSVPPPPRRN